MDRQIRLIGIDLDGTLLTRQKELTAASRRALTDAIRAGIEVVPVTGRPLAGVPREVLDIPEMEGVEMPKPHDFLSAEQRDGTSLQAAEIYKDTWEWLKRIGCSSKVSPQLLERYAMCSARWIQCEEMTNRLGKH